LDQNDFENNCEKYLLGQMTEQEQAQFEEKYFEDDALFERFLAVKEDLVDAYARGQLTGPKLELFETHFQATHARQQKVEEARTFIKGITAVSNRGAVQVRAPESVRAGWWQVWSQRIGVPALALQSAAALLVILALLAGWIWIRNVQRDRDEQRNLAKEVVQPTPSPDGQQSTPPNNERVVGNKPTPTPAVGPSPGSVNSRPPAPAQIASLTLVPFAPRDGGAANTLQITPDTRTASLRLTFKADTYRSYLVTLKTLGGRTVSERRFSRATSSSSGNSLTFNVASSLLTEQDYLVTVSGLTPTRQSENIADYFFRVAR
jgi:hypothetical protein